MQAAAGGRRWRGSFFLGGGAGGCAGAVRSGKAGRLWALCRWRCWRWCVVIVGGGLLLAWSSGAALAALILPGAGGGQCDLLRRRCAGVVIGTTAAQRPARAGLLIRQAGQAVGVKAWAKEKGQGRRRGVRCCSGLWSALAAMVPAGCVPVPVVGLICWRCRWAWSALALFQPQRFQRHGWRWRCSIRAGFGRLPEGSDSPPNGIEKQV